MCCASDEGGPGEEIPTKERAGKQLKVENKSCIFYSHMSPGK